MKPLCFKLLGGAALALTACAVLAQGAPAPAASPGAPPSAAATGDDHADMHERMIARQTQRLEQLRQALRLSPRQEDAWAAYRAAMQPAGARPEPGRREELAGLSTPERIDRMNDWMARHQEQMRQRGAATKAFYATLDEQQKKVFDRATLPPRHEHRARHAG